MPKVKFTRDFQGTATKNQWYEKGQVADLPDWQARMCIAEGAAEWVKENTKSEPPKDETPTPPAAAKKARAKKVK